MKKFFIAFTILGLMFSSCGDNKISASDVPPAAVSAFTAKYPAATDVNWITESKNGKTLYEAQFKFNNEKTEAEFDSAGNFVQEN